MNTSGFEVIPAHSIQESAHGFLWHAEGSDADLAGNWAEVSKAGAPAAFQQLMSITT